MSNIVHVIGRQNAVYLVGAIWIVGFIYAVNYVQAEAKTIGAAMTPKSAVVAQH